MGILPTPEFLIEFKVLFRSISWKQFTTEFFYKTFDNQTPETVKIDTLVEHIVQELRAVSYTMMNIKTIKYIKIENPSHSEAFQFLKYMKF